MRSLFLTVFLATALLPVMGCDLYFDNGGDVDPPCDDWGGGSGQQVPEEANRLRNPQTGVCEDFGWGGPNPWPPCDNACGPCTGRTEPGTTNPSEPDGEGHDEGGDSGSLEEQADPAPEPTWGQCDSYCTDLEEGTCLATNGCRGIYAPEANGLPGEFLECWATDQNPGSNGDCEGLDAYGCSTSDACVAVHEYSCDLSTPSDQLAEPECVPGYFLSCHNEVPQTGCYTDQDCDANESCNAGEVCLSDGSGDAVCYGFCVPNDCPPIAIECADGYAKVCPPNGCEADCICEPIVCPPIDIDCGKGYTKVCPANGCEADCVCEPNDPGECDGDLICAAPPPFCEEGTTAGIANGCWTGACIDLSLCPQATCGDIAGESMCIARDDCSPFYVGGDCSCDANGCSCSDWVFDSCETGAP